MGGHDNCQTEHIIDKYRADIAVLSDGNVTGVIEVCNTHETDKEKWTYLNKNKIPCLEIDAQSVIDVHLRDRKHVECLFDNLHMFLDCKQCQRLKKEAQSKCIIKSLPWIAGKTYFKEVVQNIYRLPVLDDSRLEGMCRKLSALDGDYIWSRLRTPGYTPEIVFNIYRILELEGGLSK